MTTILNAPYGFADVEAATLKFFGITREQLYTRHRNRVAARRRFALVHLARLMTSLSLPDIAARMRYRDHTSVLHAQHEAMELVRDNFEFAQDVLGIAQILFRSARHKDELRDLVLRKSEPPPPTLPAAAVFPEAWF